MIKLDSNTEKKIESMFSKLIQDEIQKKDLIDTGALYRSIDTKLIYEGNGFSFEIYSEDYYKYLDEPYSITEDAMNSDGFDRILDLIQEAMVETIEDSL